MIHKKFTWTGKKVFSITCIGMLVFTFLGILLVLAAVYAVFLLPLRSNPGVVQSMKIIQSDPVVADMFGSPIQQSPFIIGTVQHFLYGGGVASLTTFISGPKQSASVDLYATEDTDGNWTARSISIRIHGKLVLRWDSLDRPQGFRKMNIRYAPSTPPAPATPNPSPTPVH